MSRLLLLLAHGANHRLLTDLIDDRHQIVADLAAPFDLCIADASALERFHTRIQALRDSAAPLFLPLLFIASSQQRSRIPARVWELADEVIEPPVGRLELMARLEKLLHTRQLSFEIETSRSELKKNFDEMDRLRVELERQNAELKNLDEQKNQLLGTAAHDLRTPLGVIAAYSDFLLDKENQKLGPEERDFVDKIRSSSAFMRDIVDDLLDVTRLSTGQLELHPAPTDITALVEHNADLNRPLAQQKSIELRCRTEKIPELLVDSRKIEQVLNNLIGNAIKFSHPNSTIEVTVECSEQVVISVKDQGQGIPSDELPAVFDPFHQTSVQSTGNEKGSGLGLAIVRRIVEGHGGQVHVESEVGAGSTFSVILPAENPRALDAPLPQTERMEQGLVYDRDTALERFGDQQALDQAIAGFMEEYPALIDLARRALVRDDSRALLRATAKLSWHLGLLSAPAALEAVLALENAGRNQAIEATALLENLEGKIQQLAEVLANPSHTPKKS